MTTLRYGVIVSGVAGSYVPHRLRQHTDVNQATAVSSGNVLAWSGTEWAPVSTSTLAAGAHTHTGAYATPADLAAYAPLATPDFTTSIEVSGVAPVVKFDRTGGPVGAQIAVDSDGFDFDINGVNLLKLDNAGALYSFVSTAKQYRSFTTSGTVAPPAEVVYVDATAGNIVLDLATIGNYYESNGAYYSGICLLFVRKDATANTVTIDPYLSETIDGAATLAISGLNSMVIMQATVGDWKVLYQYSSVISGTDSGWIDLTLSGNWVALSNWPANASYAPAHTQPMYRKVNGIVYFQGASKSGTNPLPAILGTLPEGYRPQYEIAGLASEWTSSTIQDEFGNVYRIATDGTIEPNDISSGSVMIFHPISFPAA
jgi:hypothetical protein